MKSVYYLREKFLAAAAFAGHKYREVYRGDLYGAAYCGYQSRGVADYAEPGFGCIYFG